MELPFKAEPYIAITQTSSGSKTCGSGVFCVSDRGRRAWRPSWNREQRRAGVIQRQEGRREAQMWWSPRRKESLLGKLLQWMCRERGPDAWVSLIPWKSGENIWIRATLSCNDPPSYPTLTSYHALHSALLRRIRRDKACSPNYALCRIKFLSKQWICRVKTEAPKCTPLVFALSYHGSTVAGFT